MTAIERQFRIKEGINNEIDIFMWIDLCGISRTTVTEQLHNCLLLHDCNSNKTCPIIPPCGQMKRKQPGY